MSIYLMLDSDAEGADQIASNRGWSNFSRWADGLSVNSFRQICHLAEHGFSQQLADLESQLAKAIHANPPADPATLNVAKDLLRIIKARGRAEVATITDGLTPDD